MASSMRPGEDAAYLQEKRTALKIAEERIKAVDAELTAARDHHTAILRDVAEFNAPRGPVPQVPLEVFSLIVKNWRDDPLTRNRTLSLVCKVWHDIVRNTASLWTDVIIRPSWEVDKLDVLCRFAQLCHQLSKDSPLDVTLDFSAILPYPAYVGRVLDENYKRFPFILPQDMQAFAKMAGPAHDDTHAEQFSYPYKFSYDQITTNFMKKLMEQNTEHVRRWRSLHITMPTDLDGPSAHHILHEMKGEMRGLVELEVIGRPNNGMSLLGSPPPNLAHLSNLLRLTTNQDVNFDQIQVNYAALTHISLKNSDASSSFIYNALSSFVATTTLELNFVGHTDPLEFDPTDKVTLPQLTYLKLVGPAFRCEAALLQIEAPRLVRLHLQQFLPFYELISAPLLSKVSSLFIQGKAHRTRHHAPPRISYSYEALKATLRQSTSLVGLRVAMGDWGDAESVKQIVMEVRGEKSRPLRRLEEVVVVQCDEHGEGFETEDQGLLTSLRMSAPAQNLPTHLLK